MRDALAFFCGLVSVIIGTVMSLPSVWSIQRIARPGVGLTEVPWLSLGFGLTAIRLSHKRRRKLGGILGFCGALMALRPLFRVFGASRAHDRAMRRALGPAWEQEIPPELLHRMVRGRLDLFRTMLRRREVLARVRVTHNVPFWQISTHTLRVDIYEPLEGTGPFPVIIAVHGSGWEGGEKGGTFEPHHRWLAQQGYVVFDVDYRLSPDVIWPHHLTDVKTAIRWVRANAAQYHADPDRIALHGRSAGAHLALMAAFTPCNPDFPAAPGLPERDDVQAVVAVYPPTDLPLLQSTVIGPLEYWLGGRLDTHPQLYMSASPVNIAPASAPPVLLAHGGWDNLVVPEHSVRLHARLHELGAVCAYLFYPWGRHGMDYSLSGLAGHMLQYDTDRFLAWALRRRGTTQ